MVAEQGGTVMLWVAAMALVVITIGVLIAKLVRREPAGFPLTEAVDIALWDDAQVDLLLDLPAIPAIEPARLGYSDSTIPITHEPSPASAGKSAYGNEMPRGPTWA